MTAAFLHESLALLGRFLALPVAPDLLRTVRWSKDPAKEITESLATVLHVYEVAARRGLRRGDRSVSVLVVGDGTTPRTGASVAMTSAWTVTSVDPASTWDGAVERLATVRARLEDLPGLTADIVIGVHSHASVAATRAAVRPGGFLCVMPCCVPWVPAEGAEVTVGAGVMSPARTLIVEYRSAKSNGGPATCGCGRVQEQSGAPTCDACAGRYDVPVRTSATQIRLYEPNAVTTPETP